MHESYRRLLQLQLDKLGGGTPLSAGSTAEYSIETQALHPRFPHHLSSFFITAGVTKICRLHASKLQRFSVTLLSLWLDSGHRGCRLSLVKIKRPSHQVATYSTELSEGNYFVCRTLRARSGLVQWLAAHFPCLCHLWACFVQLAIAPARLTMDHDIHTTSTSNLTTFTSSKRRRNTLTKNPPPSAYPTRGSLYNQQFSTALQRAPSAPSPYQRSLDASRSSRDFRQRSQSNAYRSSTSSLEHVSGAPSPIAPASDFFASTTNGYPLQHHIPLTPQTSDDRHNDLIGAPFDASGLLSSFEATSMNEKQNAGGSSPFPNALTHTHTSPDLRSHPLRTSQTFGPGAVAMMEVTPPKSENGTFSPKRFSGDGHSKPAGPFRKKSGFSSFVNNMLGSPRTIKISAPENPMHMIHVDYDNQTGQFTVSRAMAWSCSLHPSRVIP